MAKMGIMVTDWGLHIVTATAYMEMIEKLSVARRSVNETLDCHGVHL